MNKRPEKALEDHDLAASFNQYLLRFCTFPEFLRFLPSPFKICLQSLCIKNRMNLLTLEIDMLDLDEKLHSRTDSFTICFDVGLGLFL